MKKLIQTRLQVGDGPKERGNCWPTTIACFLDLESPEEVYQVQETWLNSTFYKWIRERGWSHRTIKRTHTDYKKDEYYLVSGQSPRNPDVDHIVIYMNGKMYHDPHPDGTGIINERTFYLMEKNKMKKLIQTRLHTGMELPSQRGNCKATVIACIMGLDSPEDAFQVQEYFTYDDWVSRLMKWLNEQGWELNNIEEHYYDDIPYFVSGETIRGTRHVCIYINGELEWDPHPSGDGLITEEGFERIVEFVIDKNNERIYK